MLRRDNRRQWRRLESGCLSRRDQLVVLCELGLVRRRLLWKKAREYVDLGGELERVYKTGLRKRA